MIPSPTVLAVDPGFASFGWAVVALGCREPAEWYLVDAGVIRTAKSAKKLRVLASDDESRRAAIIARELTRLIDSYRPSAIVAEAISPARSSSVMAKMGRAWGVVDAIATMRRLPLVQASPQAIKKATAGKKNATKEEVAKGVRAALINDGGFEKIEALPETKREHAWDAAGAFIAAKDSDVVRVIVRMAT